MNSITENEEIPPLFLPLIKRYYYLVKHNMQDSEIRPNRHMTSSGMWSRANVYRGRKILFSNGYGKSDRTLREIKSVVTTIQGMVDELKSEGIPQWHIDAVEAIYGKRDSWLIAYF